MKKQTEEIKKSGSYYTPQLLADFIVFHIFTNYTFNKEIKILEPSVGDGIFFNSLLENTTFPNFSIKDYTDCLYIESVEKDKNAFTLAKKNSHIFISKTTKFNYLNQDYLDYQTHNNKKFDLVIGNPPYIRNHHLSERQIKSCELIHKKSGLSPKKIKNIWTSFLIGGVQALNEQGVLAFVLPAELLQVIYAKELRDYLKENFEKIEIFAFDTLIFPDIEQDVVVLICGRKQVPGVSFYQVSKLDDLKEPLYTKKNSNIHRLTLDKWTNYILSDEELSFLDSFKRDLLPIKNYCRAEVGIVTAANEYFIVDNNTVEEYKLESVSKQILQKGSLMPSTLRFTKKDFKEISLKGKPTNFLAFENKKKNVFSKRIQEYLKIGEELNLHKRYKCNLRDNWYHVPTVWTSEAFFTKRSSLFPKMVLNEAKVIVTDSFYRIRMKEDLDVRNLTFSFYNTLTLIFCELEGRYYGGSVLELTPNEFKNLAIPYCTKIPDLALSKLDSLLRDGVNIRKVLKYTDSIILKKQFKISDKDIIKLQDIYIKLVRRRLKALKLDF